MGAYLDLFLYLSVFACCIINCLAKPSNLNTQNSSYLDIDYEDFLNDPDAKTIEINLDITSCSNLNKAIVATDIISVFLVSFISAFLPYFPYFHYEKSITWINCFGAGILLGTSFFHLFPEIQNDFKDLPDYEEHSMHFEIFMLSGFFLVLMIEQFVMTYCNKYFKNMGLSTHCHGPGFDDFHPGCNQDISYSSGNSSGKSSENQEKLLENSNPENQENQDNQMPSLVLSKENRENLANHDKHCHEDVNSHSVLRSLAFVASLAVHCVIEGAFLVLQTQTWQQNASILISMLVHKIAIGLTMGFKLKTSKLSPLTAKIALFTWTLYSSVGGIFSYLFCSLNWFSSTAIAPLSAVGLGSFLYVLFFEITPHEFLGAGSNNKFFKSVVMLGGVGFTFWLSRTLGCGHAHSHDGGNHEHHGH